VLSFGFFSTHGFGPRLELLEEMQDTQDAEQLSEIKSEHVKEGEEEEAAETAEDAVPPAEAAAVSRSDQKKTKTIRIPPIWVPSDQRTHAALIYTYFRAQTSTFLPPDPVPEPPHIVMIFDAYKKKDLAILLETCRDDIPLYGFFNSDNPQTAVFIANSVEKYNAKPYVP